MQSALDTVAERLLAAEDELLRLLDVMAAAMQADSDTGATREDIRLSIRRLRRLLDELQDRIDYSVADDLESTRGDLTR